jgi:copper chaperone CopZ
MLFLSVMFLLALMPGYTGHSYGAAAAGGQEISESADDGDSFVAADKDIGDMTIDEIILLLETSASSPEGEVIYDGTVPEYGGLTEGSPFYIVLSSLRAIPGILEITIDIPGLTKNAGDYPFTTTLRTKPGYTFNEGTASASDYTINPEKTVITIQKEGIEFHIKPMILELSQKTPIISKTYDGYTTPGTALTISNFGTYFDTPALGAGDTIANVFDVGSCYYNDKDVDDADTFTINLSLKTDNYLFKNGVSNFDFDASINPKAIDFEIIDAQNKIYDGNATATRGEHFDLKFNGAHENISTTDYILDNAFYNNANIGKNRFITVQITLADTKKMHNYSLPVNEVYTDATLEIETNIRVSETELREITDVLLTDKESEYNGMTKSGIYDSAKAAIFVMLNKPGFPEKLESIDISFAPTSVIDAGTYTVTIVITLTADTIFSDNKEETREFTRVLTITPKVLTVSGITAQNKMYDGTNVITIITDSMNVGGIAAIDDNNEALLKVTVRGGNGHTLTAAPGVNKTVFIELDIEGSRASNYSDNATANTTVTIRPTGQEEPVDNLGTSPKIIGLTVDEIAALFEGMESEYNGLVQNNLYSAIITYLRSQDGIGDIKISFIDGIEKNAGVYNVRLTLTAIENPDEINGNLNPIAYAFSNGEAVLEINVQLTITKKALTVSNVTAQDKEYDGNTVIDMDTNAAVFDGQIPTDDLTISVVGETGFTADASVGKNKKVYVELTLGGADRDNYLLTALTDVTATIRPTGHEEPTDLPETEHLLVGLTIDEITALLADKSSEYDGTVQSGYYSDIIAYLESVVGIADVDVEFDNLKKDAGEYDVRFTLKADEDPVNEEAYAFSDEESTLIIDVKFTVEKRALRVTGGITAYDKTYNGDNVIPITESGVSYDRKITWDDLVASVLGGVGYTDNASVGKNKPVYVKLNFTGADRDNYKVEAYVDGVTATIRPTGAEEPDDPITESKIVELTVAEIEETLTGHSSVYDGTAQSNYYDDIKAYLENVVGIADVDVEFDNIRKDVGVYDVRITLTAEENPNGNPAFAYGFSDGESTLVINTQLTITKRELTITGGITAEDKTYDGNNEITVAIGSLQQIGKIPSDDLQFGVKDGKGYTDNASVGKNKQVYVNLILSGADADNYKEKAYIENTTVNILPSGVNPDPDPNPDPSDDRIIDLTVEEIEALFTDKRSEYDGTVQIGYYDDIKDYLLSVEGIASVDVVFDNLRKDAGAYNVTITLRADEDTNGNPALAYGFSDMESELVINAVFTVEKRALTVTSGITAYDKTYDGNNVIQIDISVVNFDRKIASDDLSIDLNGVNGYTDNASVGKNKPVYVKLDFTGADRDNYKIEAYVNDVTATIRPTGVDIPDTNPDDDRIIDGIEVEEIIALFTDKSSEYDGTVQNGYFESIRAMLLAIEGIGYVYVDYGALTKDVGVYDIKVTVKAEEYPNRNPALAYGFRNGESEIVIDAKFIITPKMLTVHGVTAENRKYDGTPTVDLEVNNMTISGVISGDDVNATITDADTNKDGIQGTVETAAPGKNKTVYVNLSLSGADLSNYSIKGIAGTVNITVGDTEPDSSEIIGWDVVDAIKYAVTDIRTTYNKTSQKDAFDAYIDSAIRDYTDKVVVSSVTFDRDPFNAGAYTATIRIEAFRDYQTAYVFGNGESYFEFERTLTIDRREVIILGVTTAYPNNTRPYDGTNVVAIVMPGANNYSGIIAGDVIYISAPVGNVGYMVDASVGKNKKVEINATIGGADAHNYALRPIADVTVTITPTQNQNGEDLIVEMSVEEIAAQISPLSIEYDGKVHDCATLYDEDANGIKDGVYNTVYANPFDGIKYALEAVIGIADARFDIVRLSKDAGIYRVIVTITAESDPLVPMAYAFGNGESKISFETTLTITRRQLTVTSGVEVENKVGGKGTKIYDGKTDVTLNVATMAPNWKGKVAEDDLSLMLIHNNGKAVGYTASPNAGKNKAISVKAYLSGADVRNYDANVILEGVSVDILPREITAKVTINEKDYDGTTGATVKEVEFDNLVEGETLIEGVDYTIEARFTDEEPGDDKSVIVTINLDNGNYAFSDANPINGTVTDGGAHAVFEVRGGRIVSTGIKLWGWFLLGTGTSFAIGIFLSFLKKSGMILAA